MFICMPTERLSHFSLFCEAGNDWRIVEGDQSMVRVGAMMVKITVALGSSFHQFPLFYSAS